MDAFRLARLVPLLLALGLGLPPTPLGAQTPAAPRGAPAPQPGKALSLQEAIQIALVTQPQIQARLQDYLAAQHRVNQALSPLLPQITGSWVATRSQDVAVTRPESGTLGTGEERTVLFWDTRNNSRLALSQLLFDFGKTWAATDAARANAGSSKEDVEIQRDLIVLAVKEGYFNLLFANRLVAVQQEAVARAELNLRSARGFYEVGTRPKFDVTRAEVDLANAQVALIQAQNAVRLSRVALNTAMGIDVTAPTEVQDILRYEPFPLEHPRLLAEALTHRPEYRQVKVRVEAADATVRQTFRDFFPNVTGNAFVGTTRADMNEVWELGVALNWPIFDGGNRIARYREAKANLEAARARVRALELQIAQETELAYLNVVESEQRIQAARKAVESAEENFRLAQGRFDAGVGTIIELTDAQLALTQALSTEAQALTDYRISVSRLERALGRR
jgi:outer membrane protein